MKHDQVRAAPSYLIRRRFQLAGALLIGALVPWTVRGWLLPGDFFEAATANTLIGNVVAVTLAFWTRLSIETYPGIRRSSVILPAALTGHGVVVVWFVLTRFPYDRVGLAVGFLLHVVWLYLLYIRAERKVRRRIAVVPFGATERLVQIETVDWHVLKRPRLQDTRSCNAIVADFSAELPDEWEAFLADAALAGRIVYQVKQLSESLTGRVELEHLSENSFGSLLPNHGYRKIKRILDLIPSVALLPFLLLPAIIVSIAWCILSMIGFGVPFGKKKPSHTDASTPGRPCSPVVGMSGTIAARFFAITAMPFTVPCLACTAPLWMVVHI